MNKTKIINLLTGSFKAKVITGVVATSVVAGGVTTAVVYSNSKPKEVVDNKTSISDTVKEESKEVAETEKDKAEEKEETKNEEDTSAKDKSEVKEEVKKDEDNSKKNESSSNEGSSNSEGSSKNVASTTNSGSSGNKGTSSNNTNNNGVSSNKGNSSNSGNTNSGTNSNNSGSSNNGGSKPKPTRPSGIDWKKSDEANNSFGIVQAYKRLNPELNVDTLVNDVKSIHNGQTPSSSVKFSEVYTYNSYSVKKVVGQHGGQYFPHDTEKVKRLRKFNYIIAYYDSNIDNYIYYHYTTYYGK